MTDLTASKTWKSAIPLRASYAQRLKMRQLRSSKFLEKIIASSHPKFIHWVFSNGNWLEQIYD
ncbi:hypothetical protein FD723_41105 (plasmid) [Nostoc sp. C052]|uniref:hypothetical protein n=1 Tax=Nostoc sp. C052 TaxID=2576902 RepID=UPI0015C35AFA|nr:hypothetical protein [Nostoc sp. C052]QLE46608.1 hypothetical protein FD723_41105 [Nostoc sp. C052]